ncbi:hypothetical protein LPB90_18355 [Chryseobacterium sp. LC2016-29]|uniref:hypothetical protein n=1 Tax=Chryseobacterium sp. LC2016-29 TaxID=2897331 RepID=UPI001E535A47|nr:hypothetical protein [Chryseobacterium sp. LC2016-29]MCD0480405.1 hypothetical protein [Chryseobacterium sp. LC2016-29]
MTHLLIEIFPSLRNAKNLQKIVTRKPLFTDLLDIINLYIDSDKTQVLTKNKVLAQQLEAYCLSSSSFSVNKLKMDAINYLLLLYPEYRTEKFVQLYIDLLPTVGYPTPYKSLSKYEILIDKLQQAYVDKALTQNNLDFGDFQRICGFRLSESHITQYIDAYFGESRKHNLRFSKISEFLENCSLARKDKRVVTEYLYLRTLEMDRMKINRRSEVPKSPNNKKEEIQTDFSDLILLGVASATISSVLSSINTNIPDDDLNSVQGGFGGGGSFGGGGASGTF